MELGEKIRTVRLEMGLSQRQLCGEEITRNMLSLIEHGSARPSMKTLTLLAQRLGKPVSYFLDADAPDFSSLTASGEALHQARKALAEGKDVYGAQLLSQVTAPLLRREALLLGARIPGSNLAEICKKLPSLDEELLLRAEAALDSGLPERCEALLKAAEDWTSPRWSFLNGRLHISRAEWAKAAACLITAEENYPEAIPLLEACYRELGDYKRAYAYACKQKR
jgi:transcriptional regulator with XRE-family HTH domain